jgi:hypothetical protein
VLEAVGFLWYYLLYSTLLYDCMTITQPALWERNLGTLSGLSAFRDRVPLCALRSLPTAALCSLRREQAFHVRRPAPGSFIVVVGAVPLYYNIYVRVVVVSLCLLRLGLQLQQQQLLLPRLVKQIINTTIDL